MADSIVRIRIKQNATEDANLWYADYVGQEFDVIEHKPGRPGHYTVDVSKVEDSMLARHKIAFVREHYAEIIE